MYQFGTGGHTQKAIGLYKVLTCSQGNPEAKGEPRTTNTGQIMYRKNPLQGWTGTTGDWPGATLSGQAWRGYYCKVKQLNYVTINPSGLIYIDLYMCYYNTKGL